MRKSLCLLLLAACLCSLNQLSAHGAVKEDLLLEQTIEQFSLKDADLLNALEKLSFYYRVPIGVGLSTDGTGPAKINIDVKRVRLKDVLNLIVSQDKRYRWEAVNGVVNFIPVKFRDPLLGRVLNTNVRSFMPPKVLNKIALRDAITELPEIQGMLKANKVSSYNVGFTSVDRVKIPENINLAMSNTTVRSILNKVIKETEFKLWVLGRDGNNRELLYVTF